MYRLLCSLTLLASAAIGALGSDLEIDVTLPVECDRKTQKGDSIEVHYRGTLASNGNKFDASYDRGTPFGFQIGAGRVIKGWEEGLLDMCIGEKRQATSLQLHSTPRQELTVQCRTLTVPPELGYGNRGMGPIPAGSTLIFETELMGIKGVPKPESIVTKATASSDETETAAETAAETGAAGKIAEKVGEAAEVIGTVLMDSDDGQEHNEL